MSIRRGPDGSLDALGLFLREMGRYPLLTREQEIALLKRAEKGDGQARDAMVTSNLRLVVSIARRYRGQVPLQDLVQEGIFGLMRAVEGCDWRRNLKFSTYATWWIRQSIIRAVHVQGRSVRTPVHQAELAWKLEKLKSELWGKLGREPTEPELGKAAGLPLDRLRKVLQAAQVIASLDEKVGDGSVTLGERLPSASSGFEEAVHDEMVQKTIPQLLSYLSARHRQLISLRFGLQSGEAMTLEAVSAKMGISRERARQIEVAALAKLRRRPQFSSIEDVA